MAYAVTTSVPVEKSKRHIEELLIKAGAKGYHTGWQGADGDDCGWDAIEFLWKGRQVRFRIPRTPRTGAVKVVRGRTVKIPAEQADRQRWRVLFLVVKAKIEAVESNVAVFEEEFMAFIVTETGKTIGEILTPRLSGSSRLLLE